MPDRFVGLDLSLNGTGVAVVERTGSAWTVPVCSTIKLSHQGPVTKTYEAQRIVTIINRLFDYGVFDAGTVKMAAIEDYAYGIKAGQTNCVFNLGEIGGCVRFHLFTFHVPYVNSPISLGKKFATGNGAAQKPLVAEKMADLWGLPKFNDKQYDASDALSLATLAAFKHYGDLPGLRTYRFWGSLVQDLEVVHDM